MSERCIFSLGREIIVQNNEKERYGVDMRKKVLILGTVMTLAAGCLVGCGRCAFKRACKKDTGP